MSEVGDCSPQGARAPPSLENNLAQKNDGKGEGEEIAGEFYEVQFILRCLILTG